MRWQGLAGQQRRDLTFDASGTIAAGGTPQLILPEAKSRGYLCIQNISGQVLMLEFGSARATCTISDGQVTAVTVTNAGFGFTIAPTIEFLGGGIYGQNGMYGFNSTNFVGVGDVGYPAPSRPAKAHCVMGASAVSGLQVNSIVIDDPGASYITAPKVFIHNSLLDPVGAALPSASVGFLLPANGGNIWFDGSSCPTDQIAVYGGTNSQGYTCKYLE